MYRYFPVLSENKGSASIGQCLVNIFENITFFSKYIHISYLPILIRFNTIKKLQTIINLLKINFFITKNSELYL